MKILLVQPGARFRLLLHGMKLETSSSILMRKGSLLHSSLSPCSSDRQPLCLEVCNLPPQQIPYIETGAQWFQ